MATAPSPNDLTRQQLDELDALLQRMLAIPLNQPEPNASIPVSAPPMPDPAPAPMPRTISPPNWRVDSPPIVAAAPNPHVFPTQVPVAEPPPLHLRRPEPERFVPPEPERFVPPEPSLTTPVEPEPMLPMAEEVPDTLPYRPSIPLSAPVAEMESESQPTPAAPPSPFSFAQVSIPTTSESRSYFPQEMPSTTPERRSVSVVFWPFVALNFVIDGTLRLTGFPGRVLTSWPVKTLLGLTGLGLTAYTIAYVGQQNGWFTLPQPIPWPK